MSELPPSGHYQLMAEEIRDAILEFLRTAGCPTLVEPGEDPLALTPGNYSLDPAARLTIVAWDDHRTIARRITAIETAKPGRLQLITEHFGKRAGALTLLDTARPQTQSHTLKNHRNVFREVLRRFLSRQFAGWKIAELSAEPDLEHSLSPAFPRALVRRGTMGWAAIASPPEATDPAACLTYGLIWLHYLRAREPDLTVSGLAVFVPEGRHRTTARRLRLLDTHKARYSMFVYSEGVHEVAFDPADCGNLDTDLPIRRRPDGKEHPLLHQVAALPGVETIAQSDGSLTLRIRGLPFATHRAGHLLFGLDLRQPASAGTLPEIEALVAELARLRRPDADANHPLHRRYPEAWLESQVRSNLAEIDATLLPDPLYGQVPAFAAGERSVIDLLAADRAGRLTVIELKASEDPHLPLQALDYWMRVDWHARRGEFSANGYFPDLPLQAQSPRLLLVSPSLRFHPTAATVIHYFNPSIEVQRVGLGIEWQKRLKVVFRSFGSESSMWASAQDLPYVDTHFA
ncbi:MAG: hypothetical protein ABI693_32615 [Bryobacteraceae bacterium]